MLVVSANAITVDEKKMISEHSILLNDYIKSNKIESAYNIRNKPALLRTASPTAAATYIYLEKLKNERMSPHTTESQCELVKNAVKKSLTLTASTFVNNEVISSENNNKDNHNEEKNSICYNVVSNPVQNHKCINSINNVSKELTGDSLTRSCDQLDLRKQQNQFQSHLKRTQEKQPTLQMNNNHVKAERLSPGINGDFQISISR